MKKEQLELWLSKGQTDENIRDLVQHIRPDCVELLSGSRLVQTLETDVLSDLNPMEFKRFLLCQKYGLDTAVAER